MGSSFVNQVLNPMGFVTRQAYCRFVFVLPLEDCVPNFVIELLDVSDCERELSFSQVNEVGFTLNYYIGWVRHVVRSLNTGEHTR